MKSPLGIANTNGVGTTGAMNSLKYLLLQGIKRHEAVRLILIAQAKVARVKETHPRVR
ncbi:hypothetical protein RHIZ404_200287 [Rhizobium sp. EC-SD404]|nr:hypothetical protein RHIZ404_200287 [Rhizobium sp. EC-SD404]